MMRKIECPIHIFHKNYAKLEYIRERSMNFQELNYILCIAKHQNLTKAAQELYISQPTLTKYLQRLEREVNGKLFVRSGNSYTATYLGRRYMEYAKKILAVNQDWEKELQDLTSYNEGELNIAFPLMRSSCMVPQIMTVFHKQYPGVRVNLREETYAIQEKLLLDDQLDFAIFNEAKPHPKLEYETLLKEEVLLVMPKGHPLASLGVKKDGKEYSNNERGKKRKLSALKSFYNYFYCEERIKTNPAALVPLPKQHEKEIVRLDADEVAILLDQVEEGAKLSKSQLKYHNKTKLRDAALLTLLLGTGIRVSECVGLDLNDVDFKNNGIKIRRKGGYETVVYFGDEVADALHD